MEAMRQLLLASGIAVCGGLAGALASWFLASRRTRREAARLASLVDAEPTALHETGLSELAPLLEAWRQRQDALQAGGEAHAAQYRRLSAEMVGLMQQADGAQRAKERFLAASNHDLRQPLQAMDLALARLRRDAPPAQLPDIDGLQDGIRTMADILDGLLLLSQLEADSLQAQPATCELQGLFAELLAAHHERARLAGVSLHANAQALAVTTDPGLLAGLLGRLLDNAINATPAGGRVLLAARVRGERVRIEVRDSGIGIAPVHQPRVFDEFFQVGNPERDHRKGFGLGLAIVSRLATLLGGRVELRSRLHGGSCFLLDLPRASSGKRMPQALLLSDVPADAEVLPAMLQAWGYAAVFAAGPRLAQPAQGGKDGIDAVICAIDTVDDPAWAALDAIGRQHPRAIRIVLSATASSEVFERAGRAHARVLLRPLAPAKLRALLAQRGVNALAGAA
ncbi:ATP-binding protein [Thermomonas sp.]|uniref:hybrid sensor histidine kinase/response regulator n=1 Tax=Thermomonas sp. TaxID=1971895 RepID=UPI0035AF5D49